MQRFRSAGVPHPSAYSSLRSRTAHRPPVGNRHSRRRTGGELLLLDPRSRLQPQHHSCREPVEENLYGWRPHGHLESDEGQRVSGRRRIRPLATGSRQTRAGDSVLQRQPMAKRLPINSAHCARGDHSRNRHAGDTPQTIHELARPVTHTRRRLLALPLVMIVAGCGATSAASKAQHPNSVRAAFVQIEANPHGSYPDAFYRPNLITVHVGQTIMWSNKDTDLHDVTADSGLFHSPTLGAGSTYRWKALRAGTYTYFCTLHPEMHGKIVVIH